MVLCANPLAQYQSQRDEILDAVKNVLESGNYILGPEVAKFEKSFAQFCGTNFAVGLNSGTDALILALKALDIGPGDEVITVSLTALATASAVIAVGAVPVLVDVESKRYTLDPHLIREAVTSKTKAIIAVHLYGQAADLDSIKAIANECGLYLIEDCAQCAGGYYKGKRLGSIGDIGCFSFYPTKNLGAIGDGGLVTTNDSQLFQRIQRLRQYGWNESRQTIEPGINSRLDEVQAAILNVKLKTLDAKNLSRIEIANTYITELASLPIQLPQTSTPGEHVYHLFVIESEVRDSLKDFLASKNIFAGIHYLTPAHQHQGYAEKCVFLQANLSTTNNLCGKILSLPMYPELEKKSVLEICSYIKSYFEKL